MSQLYRKPFQLTTEKHLLASSAPFSIDKRQHCKDAKSIFTNDLIVIKLDLYIMLRDHWSAHADALHHVSQTQIRLMSALYGHKASQTYLNRDLVPLHLKVSSKYTCQHTIYICENSTLMHQVLKNTMSNKFFGLYKINR